MALASMAALRRRGSTVQHFHSSARFSMVNGAPSITGLTSRHLDSWLMSPPVARELFAHSARLVDFSVIEGRLDDSPRSPTRSRSNLGSSLWELAESLQAPVVAVVKAQPVRTFHVPRLPGPVQGILLDQVASPRQWRVLGSMLEAAWNAPVVGGVGSLSAVRSKLQDMAPGSTLPSPLCEPLAESFDQYARWDAIHELATARPMSPFPENVFGLPLKPRGVTVAVAFDEVFNCYFSDTLDLLEFLGARVVDFSPLHDDGLPEGTDIAYFGCGHPERYAAALAGNQCMEASLRQHVCSGRRVYAESGGLAYLCQHICLPEGRRFPMVGILPAEARLAEHFSEPEPVEVYVERENWLAPVGERLRGYRNTMWELVPRGPLRTGVRSAGSPDLVMRYNAIGSRLHLNFATQPRVFRSFLRPRAPALPS